VLDFGSSLFLCGCESHGFLWQAADFADHVASGALTLEFAAKIERLWAQHTDAVREKSAAENKSCRLTERLATAEAEKGDLHRQLVEERRDANKAIADAQAAQAEAKLARAVASLARQRVEELEARLNGLCNHVDKTEASTRAEVERTHAQLVDAYWELGARTAAFEAPDQEVGLCFLEWLQEELGVLPTIVTGLMSFASLVTCKGAVNALSRKGCGHYEVFDHSDKGFEREIFQVEDPVLKRSVGALFDRMWGPHGRETVWERSDRAIDQVKAHLCVVICVGMCGFSEGMCYCYRWRTTKRLRILAIWTVRCPTVHSPRHRGWSWRRHPMRARAPQRSPRRLELAKTPRQPLR
jgi:hypothetical protein